jgi:hypothetical protein
MFAMRACCRHWVDYEDKELDPEGVKLAEMVIKVGGNAALTVFDQRMTRLTEEDDVGAASTQQAPATQKAAGHCFEAHHVVCAKGAK